jgi:DNA-binding transcriptional MocR family regulator
MPAERVLASQLGISRGTVVAAFARLRAEGWLSTRHGSGSTVRIPDSLRVRYAPLQVDHFDGLLDFRLAVPAAPVDAYTAAAQRALARSTHVLLGDGGPSPGLPELCAQVADRFTRQGLATRPEQVLITSGARAAMTLLVAHLRPRAAVVESPTYHGILGIVRRPGRRLVPVPVTGEGWDTGRLTAAFNRAQGGVALLVPDFHNPTGAQMDSQTRVRVAALAARAGVTVIADEIMRDLDLRDPPAPVPHIRGAIIVGSLSKTIWSGLRVGWIRAPERLIRELLLHPLCAPCTPPPMEQLVTSELLPELDTLIKHRTGELRFQRDHLANALRDPPRQRAQRRRLELRLAVRRPVAAPGARVRRRARRPRRVGRPCRPARVRALRGQRAGQLRACPLHRPARDPQQGGGPPEGRPRQFGIAAVRLAVRLS